ncbi:redoxin domain-containing protein [Chitinophaga pinensis]|uniref:Redoxin domain-containing protein n=1 Tax=Chitinophaga pinensis TaxID=79329 RepID=A0A5C6LME7_9BACT|nr:redoxin domain-containing protein [Chitinophaga pinensis]
MQRKGCIDDFWASFCQPCLAQFPRLQAMQDKFGKELQIITITSDRQETVRQLFDKSVIRDLK